MTCVKGEEDVWVKDPDLGVDFWVPMAETSGSSVRCLLPSRDGGWREPTGDMGTSRAEGHGSGGMAVGACAPQSPEFRSTLQCVGMKASLRSPPVWTWGYRTINS